MEKIKLKEAVSILKEACEISTMERANFDAMWEGEDVYPIKAKEVTPFIKEKTRLWRESWITDPLKEAIKIIETEVYK